MNIRKENNLDSILDLGKPYRNRIIRFLLIGINPILLGIHVYNYKGLERPEGIAECLKFLMNYPDKYIFDLIIVISLVVDLVILEISFIVSFIAQIFGYNSYYDTYDDYGRNKISVTEYMVSNVLILVCAIIDCIFLKGL